MEAMALLEEMAQPEVVVNFDELASSKELYFRSQLLATYLLVYALVTLTGEFVTLVLFPDVSQPHTTLKSLTGVFVLIITTIATLLALVPFIAASPIQPVSCSVFQPHDAAWLCVFAPDDGAPFKSIAVVVTHRHRHDSFLSQHLVFAIDPQIVHLHHHHHLLLAGIRLKMATRKSQLELETMLLD